ncbi:MAG: CapA family protein [Lachnospiraceae bacterium]
MKRHKKRKKQITYFIITLIFVCLLGTVMLGLISVVKGRKKQEIASVHETVEKENGVQEEIPVVPSENDDEMRKEESGRDTVEEEETSQSQQEIGPVVMAFGGDVCFHDAYANMHSLRSRGGKIESSLSAELLSEMQQADILMVNNEFTYSKRGVPLPEKAFAFRSDPGNVNLLYEMGVDIVSLANNHVYDYGEDALLDTLDTLKNAEIPYVGAGRNLDEASAPFYYEINGRTIAYISATQVERNENPDTRGATEVTAGTFRCFTEEEFGRLLDAVKEADRNADLTVVYIHWGTENTDELHWAQEWQAPELVKAGADLIVGDHPHCLQGIDYIDGVPVFYSLGNFWFNSKTLDTGLLKVVLDENGELTCQFLPAKQHDCRTDLETGEEKQRILDYLQCISPNVTIDENGYISNVPYDGPPINYDDVQRLPPKPEEQLPDQQAQPEQNDAAAEPVNR